MHITTRALLAVLLVACAGPEDAAETAAIVGGWTLPIEVMPTNPAQLAPASLDVAYVVDRTFLLSPEGAAQVSGGKLYLQGHGLGYRDGFTRKGGKGSVQLNTGPWIDLDNATAGLHVLRPEADYDGIGGGFRTVRLTIELAALGAPIVGTNTIRFRFNGTDGTGSGYRIIDLNLRSRDGATSVLGPFGNVEPLTWQPPLAGAQHRVEGERLFRARNMLRAGPSGRPLVASCSDCHAQDGRDLEYYAYSNESIVTRSVFHGLTSTQGNQIASFIRSLPNVGRHGRPWNPPYQPGEGRDALGSVEWAAGAGLGAVLEHEDAGMLAKLFPYGTDSADHIELAIEAAAMPARTLNLRELPVAIQLPDWNSWLPEVHPLDLWGECYWDHSYVGAFRPAATIAAGAGPSALAHGDFNRDGIVDLAVAHAATNTVAIQLGTSGGGFAAPVVYPTGNRPSSIAVGSFNGDAYPDLVVANRMSNTVMVMFGTAAGSFPTSTVLATGVQPVSVVVGRLDSNTFDDIAVASYLSNTVDVFLGNGAGAFPNQLVYGTNNRPVTLAVGRFNGDAIQDLAVTHEQSPAIRVILGNGAGMFVEQTTFAANNAGLAVGDFDGNGYDDLAFTNTGLNTASILLRSAGPTLQVNFPVDTQPTAVGIADLDNDGHLDLVVTSEAGAAISVLFGVATAIFEPRTTFAVGSGPSSLVIADFDRNGLRDVAVANRGGSTLSVLLGKACTQPPVDVSANVAVAYQAARDALASFTPDGLPSILGGIEDATRAFVDTGWRTGREEWRAVRGLVLDHAVQRGYSNELVKRSLAQWMGVKYWELMHEFALEDYGPDVFGIDGEVLSWPMGGHQGVHPIAPHITSIDENFFKNPIDYGIQADQTCADPALCPLPDNACDGIATPACTNPMHAAQTEIKGDYDSSAWYHLQMLLHAGARNLGHGEATKPVDWPYALEHIDDVARDIMRAGEPAPPWESLRFIATLMKAYQMRDNDKGPALNGWALRDVSPRHLISSTRGQAENIELQAGLDTFEPGLRLKVTNAFLGRYLAVADPANPAFGPANWPRRSTSDDETRPTWWKVDDSSYVVTPAANGPGQEFTLQSFHHADHIYRTIPRLVALGADPVLVNTLIDRAIGLWPGPLGAKNDWDSLRP